MKHLKAVWVGSNPGGGVSIQNIKMIKSFIREFPDGRSELIIEDEPIGITVRPAQKDMSRNEPPFVLDNEEYFLKFGEFVVQDIPDNRQTLKAWVKCGLVRMVDWGLHAEFLEKELPKQVETRIVEKKTTTIDISGDKTHAEKERKKKETLAKLRAGKENAKAGRKKKEVAEEPVEEVVESTTEEVIETATEE